ncbi:hypothetical protein, partial [Burkholderia sp. Bp8986]|uniref:hypothetical protein n=1 Tax=Burkholderia sp. Bp8986 TaxID=2184550 RepID=UPI000FBDD62C
MSVGFSLQRNSTPLNFSCKNRHELKDILTQASVPDRSGKPTVYQGTLYHDGKKYLVTRFHEVVGGQQVARHTFSRQVDWEQSWAVVIENLFSKYVLDKTWIGQRKLENVRQEFEVLLEDAKDQSRLVVFKHGLDIDSNASLPHRKLADAATALVACRELERSIHPAKRLDEAGYTEEARGAVMKGGFQQPWCHPYSEERDATAPYVFTLKNGARVTADERLLHASPAYRRIVAQLEPLEKQLGAREGMLMSLAEDYSDLLMLGDNGDPTAAIELSERLRQCEKAQLDDAKQLSILLNEKVQLERELKTLVDRMNESEDSKDSKDSKGWKLEQKRLFNALVDQMWMIGTAITWANIECPAGRTYGTPEEIAKQTALLKQYG